MASYKRPFSKSELRQIRRQKRRIFVWCAVALFLCLAALSGMLYIMYAMNPH